MLIFKEDEQNQLKDPTSSTSNKRERYRREIRQTSLKSRFDEIRLKLMEELHSESLKTALCGLSERFDEEEFRHVVGLLDGNCGSVVFNQRIAQDKLDCLLVDILLANEKRVELAESSRVLAALSHLTYFSPMAIQNLMSRDDFFDHLRRRLDGMAMDRNEDLQHFNQILSLLMNMASDLKPDFNLFLGESDICLIINRQLAKTIVPARNSDDERYNNLVIQARDFALRVFFNIVHASEGSGEIGARLVANVLRDQENLMNYPSRTFLLVAEGMRNDTFWKFLMSEPDRSSFFIQICHAFDEIQARCLNPPFLNDKEDTLTPEQTLNFYGIVSFLNELFYEDDEFDPSFVSMIENMLNGYMLAQFIIEAQEKREKDHLVAGIKLLWHLARTHEVTGEQLVIVRPANDPLELLKVLTESSLLVGRATGRFCFEILQLLLRKDRNYLSKLMEMRILDKLMEALEVRECKQMLIKTVQLAVEIVATAKILGEDREICGLMGQKGIVQKIEKILEHPDRDIYVKAEEFMEAVTEERQRQ